MDNTIIDKGNSDAGISEVKSKESLTVEIEASQTEENINGELKEIEDEIRYCFFKYYCEAEEFNKKTSGEECGDFRRAIVKTISKISEVSKTINALERGDFNKFILSQKHIGETAFLQMLKDAIQARGFNCTYINFDPHIDKEHETNFNQLLSFIKSKNFTLENTNKFLEGLSNNNQSIKRNEHNQSKQRNILFIDNIDLAFCEIFRSKFISIKKIQAARSSLIKSIKEINANSSKYMKTCVVSLRKRKKGNAARTEDDFSRNERISLRGEWENCENFYSGLFFAELLETIENNHGFDIYGAPINITHEQYEALKAKCNITKNNQNIYCKFSLTQSDIDRIIRNSKTPDNLCLDEFFKGKFIKIIKCCDGNPYFIVRPMIEALKCNSGEDKECKIDKNIKKYFRKLWRHPEPETGEPKFVNFLETLPLYLFSEIDRKEFEEIYEDAVILLEEVIKKSNKNKNTNIYPIEIANELKLNEKYDETILKSIFETLEDNRAIIVKDNLEQQDGMLGHYNQPFKIHPFLHYVFSDINRQYFNKY